MKYTYVVTLEIPENTPEFMEGHLAEYALGRGVLEGHGRYSGSNWPVKSVEVSKEGVTLFESKQ